MADIGMLHSSYYNPLTMFQRQSAQQSAAQQHMQQMHQQSQHQNSEGGQNYWYHGYPYGHPHAAHHQATSAHQQYLDHDITWHQLHHPHLSYQQHHPSYSQQTSLKTEWNSEDGNPVGTSEPSPPITISGSEVSSPGTPSSPPANNNNNNSSVANNNTTPIRASQIRSPYEWMNKPSYQSQPNPGLYIYIIEFFSPYIFWGRTAIFYLV